MVEQCMAFRHESELLPHSTDRLPQCGFTTCHMLGHMSHMPQALGSKLHACMQTRLYLRANVTDNMYILNMSCIVNE